MPSDPTSRMSNATRTSIKVNPAWVRIRSTFGRFGSRPRRIWERHARVMSIAPIVRIAISVEDHARPPAEVQNDATRRHLRVSRYARDNGARRRCSDPAVAIVGDRGARHRGKLAVDCGFVT